MAISEDTRECENLARKLLVCPLEFSMGIERNNNSQIAIVA